MKVQQQPAYLLQARPYLETSLLIDLFTQEHGRLMLIAKGARRGKARTRGLLSPFKFLLTSWAGKGQLATLTSVEQDGHRADLNGKSLASGYYMNELLLRLLHRHDAHENLFTQYRRAVDHLSAGQSPRWILRVFEKQLLHHIGFGAVLVRDAESGEAIAPARQYRYIVEKGPVAAAADTAAAPAPTNPPSDEYALTLRGSTLCALHAERLPAAGGAPENELALRQAKRLMRMLLNRQLQDRRLRSRRVAMEMHAYRTHHADYFSTATAHEGSPARGQPPP